MPGMKARARGRGILLLTACALLALVVGTTGATAGLHEPAAAAAKKKCKKGKKSATVSRKKKCKKKKTTTAPVTTLPTPTPGPPGPRPPITLSWTGNAVDLDLYVWDAAGNEAGPFDNDILESSNSGNVPAGGPEIFTDNQQPYSREFSVGVCMFEDDDGGRTDYQFDYVDENGVVIHASGFFQDPNPGAFATFDGGQFGPYDPDVPTPGAWCDISPR